TELGGASVAAGATVGLGEVVFDVAGSASGVVPVMVAAFPATSLSDPEGNDLTDFTVVDGSITILADGTVPQPGSLVLLGLGAAGLLGYRAWRRRPGRAGLGS